MSTVISHAQLNAFIKTFPLSKATSLIKAAALKQFAAHLTQSFFLTNCNLSGKENRPET